MKFELVGPVRGAATFADGRSIRELQRLRKVYGKGRWRKRKGFATVRFENGIICKAEVHWYEASGIGRKDMSGRFVICISNEEYPASLEPRKLYEILPDTEAAELGFFRVKDESGEDYLFPKELFVPVELPAGVEAAVVEAA